MGSLPHKFPRTPHLFGSSCSRDDKVLSERETREVLALPLDGDEKVDGANLGVGFDETTAQLSVQNRGHILGRGEHAQYAPLWGFLSEREGQLFDRLGSDKILFGEWCYARHSIAYTRLPAYFLAFDLYDKSRGVFLSRVALETLCAAVDIPLVPRLFQSEVLGSVDRVKELLTRSKFGDHTAEGIVLRREVNGLLVGRWKFVREDFIAGITEHWRSRPVEPNRLSAREPPNSNTP